MGQAEPGSALAARFAAKEGVFKALAVDGREGLRWRDVEVISGPNGDPSIRLHGEMRRLAVERGVDSIHVTLTHTRDLAAASVVLQGRQPADGGGEALESWNSQ